MAEATTPLAVAKTLILIEFEKVCPTELSFGRVKKAVHNIFDDLQEKLEKQYTQEG